MKTNESLSKGIIKRVVFIVLVLLILLGMGVFAGTNSVKSVTIRFSDKTELTVVTTKTNIGEILKENNIYILDEEVVTPGYEETIGADRLITISRKSDVAEENAKSETVSEVIESTEILNSNNGTIVEKIVKKQ